MKFNQITEIVGDTPCMSNRQGKLIYDLIIDNDITQILELGMAHGTGSNYMAAALEEKGNGLVISIDNQTAKTRVPSIQDMLNKTNLHKYVQPIFANSSYNWELMKLIEKNTVNGVCTPQFDFYSWNVLLIIVRILLMHYIGICNTNLYV